MNLPATRVRIAWAAGHSIRNLSNRLEAEKRLQQLPRALHKSLWPKLQIIACVLRDRGMDNNLLVAVVTSVSAAGSTAGVPITARVLNNKRFDLIEKVSTR